MTAIPTIIALSKDVYDANSEATAKYHVLANHMVDHVNKQVRGLMQNFMSPTAKQPAFQTNVTLAGVPDGDGRQWVYLQLLAAADNPANAFAGATPVIEPVVPEGGAA